MTPELIVISEPSPLISSSAQLDENVTVAASTSAHAFEFEYVPEVPDKILLEVNPEITEPYVPSVNVEVEWTPKLRLPETLLKVIFP